MKFKLLVLGVFVFISTVVFSMAIHTYVLRSRAAAANMPIRITEKTGSISGTKDVNVSFTNSEKISAFTLVFKTTGAVKVQSTREPSILGNPSTPTGFFTEPIKTTEKISYGVLKADAELPIGVLVPVTLRCEGTGAGTFSIVAAESKVVGSGQDYPLDPIEEGNYTCASAGTSPTSTPSGIRAHFSPAFAQLTVGQQTSTNLLIDGFTADQKVSAFDVKMKVDAGIDIVIAGNSPSPTVTAPSVTTSPGSTNTGSTPGGTAPAGPTPDSSIAGGGAGAPGAPGGGSSTTNPFAPISFSGDTSNCRTIMNEWNTVTRVLRLSQLCTSPTLLSSVSMPIAIKGVSNGSGTITILEHEVVGPGSPTGGYSVAKEPFSFTVGSGGNGGPGQSGNVQLKLKLRLQGIQSKPRNPNGMQFKVGVATGSEVPVFQNASFVPNDSGLYEGTVGINTRAGSGYCIFIKGPQQLQKKVCDTQPTELAAGSYKGEKGTITLNNGENMFDFSRIYLMSCDLPVQDGICNSQDMVKIRATIGKNDAISNAITDLNQDTTTNGTDWALALSSLSIKVDD